VAGEISMNRQSDSIALAEQQVAEAQAAALAEFQAVRAKLNRRMSSPVFVGGLLLGAIALIYLVPGRGKPKRPLYSGNPGAWSRAVKTVQVLLPLLMAFNAATKAARRPRADIGGTVN
jgi:hypothetical protein